MRTSFFLVPLSPFSSMRSFSLKTTIEYWPSGTDARQYAEKPIFVSASQWPEGRIRGGEGRTRASAWALLDFAGHRHT